MGKIDANWRWDLEPDSWISGLKVFWLDVQENIWLDIPPHECQVEVDDMIQLWRSLQFICHFVGEALLMLLEICWGKFFVHWNILQRIARQMIYFVILWLIISFERFWLGRTIHRQKQKKKNQLWLPYTIILSNCCKLVAVLSKIKTNQCYFNELEIKQLWKPLRGWLVNVKWHHFEQAKRRHKEFPTGKGLKKGSETKKNRLYFFQMWHSHSHGVEE